MAQQLADHAGVAAVNFRIERGGDRWSVTGDR
jgi:hypothetical protein